MRGVSLIEMLIVVAVIVVLVFLLVPLGMDFYRSQQLDTNTKGMVQVLRQAQQKAQSVEMDSSFGFYLTDDHYTLFRGVSYASREQQYDQVFDLPGLITVSGLQEVVFSKLEGRPSATGDIALSNGVETATININEVGRISY